MSDASNSTRDVSVNVGLLFKFSKKKLIFFSYVFHYFFDAYHSTRGESEELLFKFIEKKIITIFFFIFSTLQIPGAVRVWHSCLRFIFLVLNFPFHFQGSRNPSVCVRECKTPVLHVKFKVKSRSPSHELQVRDLTHTPLLNPEL